MDWRSEIIELHEFFEAWFLGRVSSLERFESVLAHEFSMVTPDGTTLDRTAIIELVRTRHGHTDSLRMETQGHTLHIEQPEFLVASYVEVDHLNERTHRRLSTVVFAPRAATPNGVSWLRVHETWLDRGD